MNTKASEAQDLRGVEDPTNCVVDELGLGECLMTALVGDDPKTSHDEAVSEGVEGPKRNASERIQVRTGKVDILGRDKSIRIRSSYVYDSGQDEIPDTKKLCVNYDERVDSRQGTYT